MTKVVFDMPDKEYRAFKAYSYSQVKQMLPTPKDYKYLLDNPKPQTAAMAIGRVTNSLILEPDKDPLEGFEIKPEPRAPKGWEDDVLSRGKFPIKLDDIASSKAAAEALRRDAFAGPILTGEGGSEVSLFFEVDGHQCKARVDRVPAGVDYLVDLKKTRDNAPGFWIDGKKEPIFIQSPFAKQAKQLHYHVQAGLYLYGWNQCVPDDPRTRWLNVTVDSEPPYHVRTFEMAQSSISAGFELFRRLLKQLVECELTNQWPGYPDEVEVIEV